MFMLALPAISLSTVSSRLLAPDGANELIARAKMTSNGVKVGLTNPPKTKYNPNAWKSPPEVTAAKVPATSAAAAAEVAAAARRRRG